VDALQGVDLELHPGEPVALLGPNGAGKTTAVSILLGQRRPDAREGINAQLYERQFRPQERKRSELAAGETGYRRTLDVGCGRKGV
jgi:ABC-2 type transport system ATP-binding protein